MKIEGEGGLVRIFIGESDRWHGVPLYEAIIRKAREAGLAGATAWRGIRGFGRRSVIHTTNILRLSTDLPIVVEIVDRSEKIEAFLATLDEMVHEGMITVEKAHIVAYRSDDLPDGT